MTMNRQWILASRPQVEAVAENFSLVDTPIPRPREGEVLVRNHFMSVDPYMRGRMDDTKSYAAPQALGKVMQGATAGVVLESRAPGFARGDYVVAALGWQEYGCAAPAGLRKVDVANVPLSAYLGCVGMPGVTAWYGINRIIEPKRGATIVVSAASGAVGAVAGQLAKRAGCRVVGVAGGAPKCAAVVDEFGFDACVDYKAGRLAEDLAAATPQGIDGYYENVGGAVLDAVLARMNAFGTIAVCGLISGYNGVPMPVHKFRSVLVNRLKVQGFVISEHLEIWPQALAELAALVASGEMKHRESISEGIESAPQAFLGLLKGHNFGKQLVRLA
ncbi:MAG: NADP-dependent oxidoreductase [Burkholderiaceae bacterium]|nr:NADP-dependent oxidoreductase [Burkholderiaceae bacterium]